MPRTSDFRVKWSSPTPQVEAEFRRRVAACAILVRDHAAKLINTDGRTAGRSRPGEPPHLDTTRLRSSVAWEVVGPVARVGTNVKYGKWLEMGTRLMAARPWLGRSFRECSAAVMAILTAPMKFK